MTLAGWPSVSWHFDWCFLSDFSFPLMGTAVERNEISCHIVARSPAGAAETPREVGSMPNWGICTTRWRGTSPSLRGIHGPIRQATRRHLDVVRTPTATANGGSVEAPKIGILR